MSGGYFRPVSLTPLTLKEQILAKVGTGKNQNYRRFKAEDSLLAFLKNL